ncbi:MAG: dipeptide ABC transporter permease DppC [Gammaproteobacteria bacterium]|nr:MAG: dipeptide ABC transporter permease DppC [Gammaproteobacteria bacterium]
MGNQQKVFINPHLPQTRVSNWVLFRHDTFATIGLIILLLIFMLALLNPIIAGNPNLQDATAQLIPPSWNEDGTPDHLLGTDMLGRDMFGRILSGASLTIGTSVIVVMLALILGIPLGVFAATSASMVQLLIMRTMDILLAIPSLVLSIIVVAILGPGLMNAGIAVTLVLLPNFVRLTRSYILEELNKPYVTAARLDGASPSRIIFKIISPNVAAPLIIHTTISLSTAIVDIAALGFLGLGAQAPLPEWGSMLSEARTSMYVAPWAVTTPGLAIFITVLSINLVGDGLNTAINSKSRN